MSERKPAKKAAKKDAAPEEPQSTDVDSDESAERGVRENNPAGVHEALKGPLAADLNPAFHDPTH